MNGLISLAQPDGSARRPPWSAAIQLTTAFFFLVLCCFSARSDADQVDVGRDVVRFDAGSSGSELEPGAAELNLDTSYTPSQGYGWTQAPRESFARPELSRSRSPMTIDGVVGQRLGFRADVAPGVWFLTLWVDAEREGTGTPTLLIQGRQQPLGWQEFRPSDEPNHSLPRIYRVFHGKAVVRSAGISFELIGRGGDVRLLGISLIRQVKSTKPIHRQLLRQLADAGSYKSDTSLDELASQVKESLRLNPADAFLALWLERLELLAAADRYSSMRGWEWADQETGLGMFERLTQAVMLSDALLSTDEEHASPLTERALFIRGRLLYWLGEEWLGGHEMADGKRDLKTLYARHPDDKLLAMYNGEKIDLPEKCDCLETTADAPAWSIAEREALCRMRQIAHWWVNHRQIANGELGGKLGDDVEILRWWAPLILSGDETAKRGWKKLADGVWQSKHVHDGYAGQMRDVEHAAEFVADTAPMMVLISDEPTYVDRLKRSARHFDNLWTGRTAKGHRFFRSAWFNSSEVLAEEPRGRDLEYNSRAVQAVRYLAWCRRDPEVIRPLHEWSLAWVNAALRTDKGKPKGIIPASVRFSDEAINGDEPNWYRANMYWRYFDWDHFCGSVMLDQLLFTYTLTKDRQLLEPMFLALDLIHSEEDGLVRTNGSSLEEGSRAWAAEKLIQSELLWSVVEQWRFLSGDSRWDDLIMRHGTPYGRYRISGEESHLVEGLDRLLENVRYNTPLKTSEPIHTDRVYAPGYEQLKAMLTGDGIWANLSPYFAVSWEKTDEDFTALVSETGRDRLGVRLYSFAPEERQIAMRIWQLAPGKYRLIVNSGEGEPQEKLITVAERGQRIPITLPARRELSIRLEQLD